MKRSSLIRRREIMELASTPEEGGGIYGVLWDYSDPSPALTRTDDAAGFSDPAPATSLTAAGSSPFDTLMPWAGMKRYNVIDGAISYSEDDAGFDQAAYDTVVYIPPFYYKAVKDTANTTWTWQISPTEREGFKLHPGSGRYIGRYHTSGSSSAVYSKSGVTPLVGVSRTNFRTYSTNKGDKWWMLDIATWSALQMLYLVEFADFDSQTNLGIGMLDSGFSAVQTMGGTDDAVYHTLKRAAASNMYRWVEDPFSNCRDRIDGFMASSRATYVGTDNATFADSTSALTATGITLPSSACITGFGYSADFDWAFIPDAGSGTDYTIYVTDRVYSDTGACALDVGGAYSVIANYGLFYFNASYTATSTVASLGSRLLFIP